MALYRHIVENERAPIELRGRVTVWNRFLAEEIAADARHMVPIDTGELHDSINVVPIDLDQTWVVVGTDHWAPTEYGSGPHWIISHGVWLRPGNPWPLRNRRTGQVFGLAVWHPGTPEQPFMRPSLYKIRSVAAVGGVVT